MAIPPTLAGLTVEVEVLQARDLVAKDRNLMGKRTTSDAYVEVHCGKTMLGRTKTMPKTCSPIWNERFRLDLGADGAGRMLRGAGGGGSAQSLRLELRIFDEDRATSDDPMGTVVIPLQPLEPAAAAWHAVTQGSGQFYCKNAKGQLEARVTMTGTKMVDVLRGNIQHLCCDRITVGLSWDVEGGQKVDLDSSVVAVDRNGNVLMDETVYYGNLSNPNFSLIHSGDEVSGEAGGDDESIFVQLDRIPTAVVALFFVMTVATVGKTFADVKSARVRFISTESKMGICRFVPSKMGKNNTALFLVRIARDGSPTSKRWNLAPIEEGNEVARDFGSLIPEIKGYARDLIPGINIDPQERIAVMRKGGTIRVADYAPGHNLPQCITFGLAWDITNRVNIDLDASAILLDEQLRCVDLVFFKKLVSSDGSIRHSGDEREGDEAGDDEKITVTLAMVEERVKYIGFVVNSYSGQELDDVHRASCHLFDPQTQTEIAKYSMSNCRVLDKRTALVMACLYRAEVNRAEWHLRIISEAAQGRTAHQNVDELQNFLTRNPPEMPIAPPEPEIVLTAMPEAVAMEDEIVVVPQDDLNNYTGVGVRY